MEETTIITSDCNVWGFLNCVCKECRHEFLTSEWDISMKNLNYCPSCGRAISLIER